MSLPPLKPGYPFTKLRGAHANWGAALALTLLTLGTGCSDTQAVQLDECGNHVVEAGEDCDGQQGCNAQCRLTCDEKAPCPAGWGCDVDAKICRVGTGSFTPVPLDLPSVSRLYKADFDGDGRDDLLGVEPFTEELSSLLFFDAQGATVRRVTLPVAFSAAIDDVTGDGLPDPILGASEVNAFNAARSRNLWPLISATRAVDPWSHLLGVDLNCDGLRDFVLFEGSQLSQVQPTGSPIPLAKLAYSAEELGKRLRASTEDVSRLRQLTPVGRFSKNAGPGCEFLAIPQPDGERIDIYGPSDAAGGTFERLSSVSVSDPGYERAFFVDLNNDGHDDLVLSGFSVNQAAYGLGDGTFHSDPSSIPDAFSGEADNQLRKYDDSGLIVGAGALPDQPPLLLNFGDYSDARVASLTVDGRLDAVAIKNGGRVDVLRGLPNALFNPLPIPGNNLRTIEDIGDFDGDGLGDVLFTAQNNLTQPASTISLLFSPVASGSSAQQLAFPGPIRELAAGYVVDATGNSDTNADIGVLYRGSDDSARLGFLLGGSDQLLRSRISAEMADEFVALREPALGHFEDPNVLELAVVKVVVDPTLEPSLHLDLFTVDDQGGKLIDQGNLSLTVARESSAINLEAIDQNGDGLDELYLNSAERLMMIRRKGERFDASPADDEAWDPLTRQDANGDGYPDLTTLKQDDQSQIRVRVLLGAGPGGRSSGIHELPVDAVLCGTILDHAFIQADDDAAPELAVVCADSTGIGVEGNGELPVVPEASLLLFDVDWVYDSLRLNGFPQSTNLATGMIVGDFNGDGVQDYASGVLQPQLWLGEPRQ